MRRYKGRGVLRGEYRATFLYVDETKTPLYGRSYFVRRFAGNRLDMTTQCTADKVEGWAEQEQAKPHVIVPALWHEGTECDVQTFAEDFVYLRENVARSLKSRIV